MSLVITAPPQLKRALEAGLALRQETPGDQEFTAQLYASTRMDELASVAWNDADKSAFLRQQHDAQHNHYRLHYPGAGWFIVELEGFPIGRLYVVDWTSETRIIDIALTPGARGKGFGTALLTDLVAEAGATGKAVSIHVERMNPALSLYQRLGFELAEDKGVYLLLECRPDQVKIAS